MNSFRQSVHGAIKKVPGFRKEHRQVPGSNFPQELSVPQTLVQSSQHHFSIEGSRRNHQMSFSGMRIPSSEEQKPPLIGNVPNPDPRIRGLSTVASRIGSSRIDSLTPKMQSLATPASTGFLPSVNIHGSYISPPTHEKIGYQPDTVGHPGMNMSNFPGPQFGSIESKPQINMPQASNHRQGLLPPNLQVRPHVNLSQPQPQPQTQLPLPLSLPSQDAQQHIVPPVPHLPSSNLIRPLNHGYVPQAHGVPASMATGLQNVIPNVHSSIPIPSIVNSSLHLPGGTLPLQGLPPVSSTMLPITKNPGPIGPNPPAGSALTGLFNTLMAQGLLSLTKEGPAQV